MASGKFNKLLLSANAEVTGHTASVGKVTTVSVFFCNLNATAVKVRLAIADLGTPTPGEWIEYDATIEPNDVLERTGIVLSPGEKVVVRSDTSDVSVRIHGFEE